MKNVPKFKKRLRFIVEVDGDIAKSIQALAFVSGCTFEEIAIDTLEGIDDRHHDLGELHGDAGNMVGRGDREGMVLRLKAYRDSIHSDYPDEIITLNELEDAGEITFDAARTLRLAISAGKGKA